MPRTILITILALSSLSATFGQTAGRIAGQVTDQTKASIPNAKVTAENTATQLKREVTTDQQGRYVFDDLPIGTYTVSVAAAGFQSQMRSGLELNVASSLVVDFTPPTGQVNEAVEVKAQTEVVDPNAANGQLMDNKSVVDLPINGRDYARFTLLTPGAVAVYNYIADTTFNGMSSVSNQFSIDGIDASRVDEPYMANGFERGARLLTGSLDTVEQFNVQTSDYNAEYGRAAGSYINIATKSGTNDFHGTAYDYFRNNILDARNFFATTGPAPEFRFNDFGGNIGGPIRKWKTFFFLNYEGSRQRIGITGSGTVPSALERSEAEATSPQLTPILNMFPIGTAAGPDQFTDNYVTTQVLDVRENTASIRADQVFSAQDSAFVRVNVNDSDVDGPLFGVVPSSLGVDDHQSVPVRTTNVA